MQPACVFVPVKRRCKTEPRMVRCRGQTGVPWATESRTEERLPPENPVVGRVVRVRQGGRVQRKGNLRFVNHNMKLRVNSGDRPAGWCIECFLRSLIGQLCQVKRESS